MTFLNFCYHQSVLQMASIVAQMVGLWAQTLQRLGYYAKEDWTTEVSEDEQQSHLLIQSLSENSTMPTRATSDSIGYDLYSSSTSEITIPAGGILPIPTGIAIQCPTGTYARIAPRSGLCIKRHITTEAGVIDPDYRGNVIVLLRNFGTEDQIIQPKECIAKLILENATMADYEKI
jgi:dUTP pyrophosphatase